MVSPLDSTVSIDQAVVQAPSGNYSQPPSKSDRPEFDKVVHQIQAFLNLDQLFQSTVEQVRQLLKADRVGIFRFSPELDWQGELIAEAVEPGFVSGLKIKIQDHCFGEQFAPLYLEGRINAIADIYAQSFSDCYLHILEQFQVRANLAVPLIKGEQLWGLLCIHQCTSPRQWQSHEIESVAQVAQELRIALEQSELLTQAQFRTRQQQALTRVIARIRSSLNLDEIFHTTTTEVRWLLKADRVGVFRFLPDTHWMEGEFVAEDVGESWKSVLKERVNDHCFGERFAASYPQGQVRAISNIYNAELKECHIEILGRFQIQANLVAPLFKGDMLWGLLGIHQCSGPRQWEAHEIEFVKQVAEQFSVALQQVEYLEQVQNQSAKLARAVEREQSLERQKTLAVTIDRIRRSLDLETIFRTTTQEVRKLLDVERVAIYRFYPDWNGEFVADSIADGWTPIPPTCPIPSAFSLDSHQAGQYPRNEVFVPILQGEKLWGLLVAYQHSQPRYWSEEEVTLLAQVGTQLGIAFQQAEYLAQVQAQSAQLSRIAEQEQAIAKTVDKIRQSLDLGTIFATTTQEIRQLLRADRIVIYRFQPGWSCEFVAESFGEQEVSLADIVPILETGLQVTHGGRYARNQTLAVDDIETVKPGQYPILQLRQWGVKAYAIAPIFRGKQLWGLLAAYQTSHPRAWQPDEINLLTHIGSQLGVAIQQAELLKQTQEQATKLAHALEEIKQSQSRLIQGEKMAALGQLVAGVAHEINNPVNFIAGNVRHINGYAQDLLKMVLLYQEHYPDPLPNIQEQANEMDLEFIAEDLPKLLSSMRMGVDRISQLVASLRNFSRIDQADMKQVDIHEGIDNTLVILQHRLKRKPDRREIEVIKEYGDLPQVECFPAQLNQVFMNIISNGIDALEEIALKNPDLKPELKIRTELTPGQNSENFDKVLIRISDNGPGIPEEICSNIYNPFFTTKPVGKGTGLGLSISYQIVAERHGGDLRCTTAAGKGTEFQIEIPLHRNAA
jgi:GAF domain-containing protein